MAKKEKDTEVKTSKKGFTFTDINKALEKVSNGFLLENSPFAKVEDWVSTGNYILNAQISGSIFKGIPSGRVTSFVGPASTGKTFIALNTAYQAQKKGYNIIWIDTEGALTIDAAVNFGIDTSTLRHESMNTVEAVTTYMKNLINIMKEVKDEGGEVPKIMVVIDSLGNLSTDKEMVDTASGSDKSDMTRAKMIKKLFRVITSDLAILQIPMIVINHSYDIVGSYVPMTEQGGGSGIKYNSTVTLQFTRSHLKDNTSNKIGYIIKAKILKSRYTKGNIEAEVHVRFDKGMNPYVGLEKFFDWENIGIESGKYISDTEIAENQKALTFAVRHLHKHIRKTKVFCSEVFTQEVLAKLDEKIGPVFGFNQTIDDDLEEIEAILGSENIIEQDEE